MKKSIISFVFLLAALVPLSTSCQKWLEATSSSQVAGDKLFATRSGFHEALVGVYLLMGNSSMYGAEYTYGANDVVCMPYSPSNETVLKAFQQHAYNTPAIESRVDRMWSTGYKCIANINKTLYELERRRDVITDGLEYNLIKGELLAARAYIHFDLMKMYGLESWAGDNAGRYTVPYSTDYSSVAPPQHTYAETADLIVQDIKDALECLQDDPVRGVKSESFDSYINSDGFWSDRQKRFNYYAVEALLARVSLWRRDFVTAGQLAADVIKGVTDNGLVHWIDVDAFREQTEYDYRDWTFSCEHIFSLEITNLYDYLSILFFNPQPNSGVLLDNLAVGQLYHDSSWGVDDLNEDVRGPSGLLKYSANGYQIYKFYSSNGYLERFRGRMPMIKLSEMYLILAEVALQAFDYDGALDYLDELRFHRGVTTSVRSHPAPPSGVVLDSQTEIVLSHILAEYLREMVGEGQFLYAFKRFCGEYGLSATQSGMVQSSIHYSPISVLEFPYPVAETTYGRVQDK